MRRSAQGVMVILLATLAGCSFTESEEISQPDASAAPAASSATTTSAVASGAEPLVALAEGAQPTTGATVAVTTAKQLTAQLASKKTAADLPTTDGRYDLSGRVIVAPKQVIDGLVDDGRLSDAVTADVAFVDATDDGSDGDSSGATADGVPADGATTDGDKAGSVSTTTKSSDGTAATPVSPSRSGSMLIQETGPVRVVVAGSGDCCGFALVRKQDAYSVEVSASPTGPTTLHVVSVSGVDPFAAAPKNDDFVPPAATAKPIGKVAIPDMTVKLPPTKRPPGITDPPPSPEKRASVEVPPPVPPGSWCGYLAMRGVPFDEVVVIWNQLGRPAHMDADGNGIPCETRY